VSNAYYTGGAGYRICWECLGTLARPEERTCDYRIVFPPAGPPIVLGADPIRGCGGER
jgi:hypothetical protein